MLAKFSNVSYSQFSATAVNNFTLPSGMSLVDVTYDLTIQQPVSLVINGTNCGMLVGYGPSAGGALNLRPLRACTGISTIGTMLGANSMATVANEVVNGYGAVEICQGRPDAQLRCERHYNTIVSNLIGSTAQLGLFPLAYTKNSTMDVSSYAGAYNALFAFSAYGKLLPGNPDANSHIPIYWDPLYSVVAGAWKTTKKEIQVFAGTPYQGWFTPPPFVLPSGDLIGFALAYKPVSSPANRPPMYSPHAPTKEPASRTGLIVGLVIGGVAAATLIGLIIVFVRRSIAFQPKYRQLPNQ